MSIKGQQPHGHAILFLLCVQTQLETGTQLLWRIIAALRTAPEEQKDGVFSDIWGGRGVLFSFFFPL